MSRVLIDVKMVIACLLLTQKEFPL